MVELTCPWDSNIASSHDFKSEKYSPLVADLSRHFRVHYYPVEISVRGQVSKGNRARIKSFIYNCVDRGCSRKTTKSLVDACSRVSLLCSFSIFSARNEPSWTSPSLLRVHWFHIIAYVFIKVYISRTLYRTCSISVVHCNPIICWGCTPSHCWYMFHEYMSFNFDFFSSTGDQGFLIFFCERLRKVSRI